MRKHNLNHIELSRATRGWVCKMTFNVETHRQFTWETHEVEDGGKNRLSAMWNTYSKMIDEVKRLRSLEGNYNF